MLRAFTVAYWIFFGVTMPLFFSVAAVIWLVTLPFDRRLVVLHMYSCWWASCYVYCNPLWRSRVIGREKLPTNGPAVLVANHQSMVDILVLYGLYRPFKWVAKAELFKVPVVGWTMVINDYVKIRRGDRESIRIMMDHCRRHLARNCPVLLFPEGTRTPDGHLQNFKEGAFRLAHEAGVPLIPIALRGTYDTLPKHGLIMRNRMNCLIQVLDPIDARKFPDPGALRDAARAAIAAVVEPAGVAGAAASVLANETERRPA